MTIFAKMICHSVSSVNGIELPTIFCRYPKFIHGEVMTHRDFSRNASSSRAIPFNRMVADIRSDMAMPEYWGANQKGMQAAGEIDDIEGAKAVWRTAFEDVLPHAQYLHDKLNLHKQVVNRLLEPWAHINVLISATRWKNFFALRDHPMAQPEINLLAKAIKLELFEKIGTVIGESKSKVLQPGQWHLPYVKTEFDNGKAYYLVQIGEVHDEKDYQIVPLDIAQKVSVARCARVSYTTFETGTFSKIADDLALYDKLVGAQPLHASPAEHQATPDELTVNRDGYEKWKHESEWGNLHTWRQYRKTLPGEYVA